MRIVVTFIALVGLAALSACSDSTSTTVTKLEISPTTASLAANTSQKLVATAVYSDSTSKDVSKEATWSSSDKAVATVSAEGLVKALKGGTTTIKASFSGQEASAAITVTEAELKSIEVTPTNPSIAIATTQQFAATGTFSDNTTQDLTDQVTWSSSDKTIATIDAKGVATGINDGKTTITAELSGVSGKTELTVTKATLDKIEVTPTDPTIANGTDQQFKATGVFSDSTTQDITDQVAWTSSDTAIATISDAAGSKGLATAASKGSTTVKATLSGVEGTTTLTVTDATLTSITITPTDPSVAKGTTQQFTATAIYSDNSNQDVTSQVTWSSSDATVGTISNATADKGLATAVSTGTTTIKAALSGVEGTTTLTVTAATLSSIDVTPSTPSIANGTTQQFVATATYSDSTTQDVSTQVTWSSSDTATATISNATGSEGLATGVAIGTSTIKAALSGVEGTTVLTVTNATLTSIEVTPAAPSIAAGTTQQLAATATYSDSTTQDVTTQVTWSSSSPATATISNATGSEGLATAVAPGTTTITATLSGQSGTTTLTVTNATLSSIAVTPADPSVAKGTTQQLTATATYSDNTTQDVTAQVTWSTSAVAIASVSNATGTEGLATAVTQGTATITATLSGQSGSTTLTVTAATLDSIAVTPPNPSIAKGTTQQFTATGTYSDGTNQDITSQVSWSSSSTPTATISNATGSRGLATAAAQGTTTITATLSGKSGTTTLTVTAATLVSIAVTPATPSIANGTTQQFAATATYTDSTVQNVTQTVTWSSSAQSVATISNAAGSRGLASAATPGQTTISAALSGKTGSTVLTVTNATLSTIAITPSNPSLPKGGTQQFTATGTFSDSSTQNITSLATWSSSNISVATVSNAAGSKGLASAANTGSATISAAFIGKTGSTTIAVTPATLVSIAVTPSNPSAAEGTTIQFTATGTYSDNTTKDLTTSVTWSSATPAVASISNAAGTEGLASAVNQGTSAITARLGAVSGTTTMQVTPATLVSIAVTPTNPSIAKGTSIQFTATGTYSDSTTQNITSQATWSSSDQAVATISNATGSNGLASGVAQGPTTITATLGGKSGSTALTVTAATLSSIAVTPPSPVAAKGTTVQFAATGTYSDNSTQDLTTVVNWSAAVPGIATISNASGSEGLASAIAQGSTSISASYLGKSGSTVLTVTPAALVSITVTPTNPSIAKGTTQEFTATGTFSDSTNQDITNQVTWSSSNTAVATISNAAGTAGLASSVTVGTTTISAALSGKSGSTTLNVTAAALVSIAVTPVNPAIAKGTTQQFVATGTFSDSSTQNITAQATWSSSNDPVATVSNASGSKGLATAVTTGTAIISAALSGKTGTSLLTVSTATLVSIAVTPLAPSIAKGTTQQFTATGTYSDSSTQDLTDQVTWSSSNTVVATISNVSGSHGLASGGGQGQTIISATLSGKSGNTSLTVTAATLVSIAVTPANPSTTVGGTQQFVATGTYSDASSQVITTQVSWSTVDPGVATISNAAGSEGLATGVATGSTTVEAKLSGVTGTTGITVAP